MTQQGKCPRSHERLRSLELQFYLTFSFLQPYQAAFANTNPHSMPFSRFTTSPVAELSSLRSTLSRSITSSGSRAVPSVSALVLTASSVSYTTRPLTEARAPIKHPALTAAQRSDSRWRKKNSEHPPSFFRTDALDLFRCARAEPLWECKVAWRRLDSGL
jgi:hypothetical protein